MSKLDEISQIIDDYVGDNFTLNYENRDYLANDIKQYIYNFCREVIGADEDAPKIPRNDYYYRFHNELREEQRNRLNRKLDMQ